MATLKCATCKRRKDEEEFAPRSDTKRGRRSYCKACAKGLFREYYKANRKRIIKRVSSRRKLIFVMHTKRISRAEAKKLFGG